ncbi:hypothetical protein ACFU99_29780 [Streptomyces sp. NPDC057654]|uniref:hypothetical protein n=1 Tax=Streptomyces sp. NPDC057654 TaxID=3346196 RepID=UPI003695F9A8
MKHRTATALLTVVIAAAGLSACGDDKEADSKPTKSHELSGPDAPRKDKPEDPGKGQTDAEANAGIPPKPDAATQAQYIRALNAISSAIVNGKEDRAVSRGRDTCGTIHSFPKDHAKQVDLTRQRFSGATQVTTTQASQILTAVRTHLCPKN